ncbi:Aste57867_10733 [Aphanomyces stellatus]|uniref:Aste57867_10733 protein n=1 Tax=Aphanomyces stellatus TaxID=120398 RepID=A0A485KS89_9STRA|nr:hypothetical protein As57867_010693 [Aphanomyces stellatus]VFT87603.1 Aste57867_10733 [Aphanomyces stellatus]
MYYTWPNLDAIVPPATVPIDTRVCVGGVGCDATMDASQRMTAEAVTRIQNDMPHLSILYFDEVDECAHETSCFSRDGQRAVAAMNVNIGRVVGATAGATHDHGGDSSFNFQTQWLVYDPSGTLHSQSAISTEDTTPTIAHLLGVDAPIEWHDHVVQKVFLQANESVFSAAKRDLPWCNCATVQCPVGGKWTLGWIVGLSVAGVVAIVVVTVVVIMRACCMRRTGGATRCENDRLLQTPTAASQT